MHRHGRTYSHTHTHKHTHIERRRALGATPASTLGIFSLSHFPSACHTFLQSVAVSFSLSHFPSVCRIFLQSVALSFSLSQFPSVCRSFLQSVALSFSLSQFPSACRTFLQPVAVSFRPPHKPTTATFHDLSMSILRSIDFIVLLYDAVQAGMWFITFQSSLLPPASAQP